MASQKMALLVLVGLLSVSVSLNGAEAQCGGFIASCIQPLFSGSVVSASCNDVNGNTQITSLDVDPFLGNNDGTLVAGSSGFSASCTEFSFGEFAASFTITESCSQVDGTIVQTSYDLNMNVANNNGVLQWNNC